MSAAPLAPFLTLRAAAIANAPSDPGLELCHALSDSLDATLASLLPTGRDDVALIAVGGYGRRELCLFSDIDLMLLCRGQPEPALVDAVFYPLWDAGLKVGHAVRTLPQTFAAAHDRLETLTALLDARLVAGSAALAEELQRGIHHRAVRRRTEIAARLAADERAVRAAAPYQLLEADIKSSRGGLRSYQRLRWLRLLRLAGDDALLALRRPLEALFSARNALHAVAAKPHDIWLQELAPSAAAWLRSEPDSTATRLYLALREIDRAADAVLATQHPPDERFGLRARAAGVVRRTRKRRVEQAGPDVRSVFGYAAGLARTGAIRLPAEGERAIAAAQGASWTAGDRSGLLALLRAGDAGAALIDELARCGWLERTLPEWRHTRGLPQHSPFHLHPLDVHLRRTVAEVVALADGDHEPAPYAAVAGQLGALDETLLAALLHDLGKGWPGDHAETGAAAAAAIVRRAGFDPDVRHTVTLAIRQHLLLPTIATRRDLSDPRVIESVADSAGRVRTLRVLYLLSVADSRASGPAVWGPWKATLLHDLFERVQDVLIAREGASPSSAPAADAIERVLALASERGERERTSRHIAAMPPGYARAFGPDDLLRHVALMAEGSVEVRLDVRDEGDAYDLALALRDRPGLIASVAGVLALHNLSVLEARFFTRADGVALQTYQLVDAREVAGGPERWQRVAADLERALSGDLPLEQRLDEKARAYRRRGRSRPAEVLVDCDAAAPLTVLEVHATDRVGLLSTIARTLYACGLDVQFAKIDTQGHEVIDAFYVRELSGTPLRDAERIRAVRATLLAAIGD